MRDILECAGPTALCFFDSDAPSGYALPTRCQTGVEPSNPALEIVLVRHGSP